MKTLLRELKLEQNTPLNYIQVSHILKGRVPGLVMKFVEVEKLSRPLTIEQFLPHKCNAALCLLSAVIDGRTQNHWSTLLRHDNGSLEWFDSMAFDLDHLGMLLDDKEFINFLKSHKVRRNTKRLQKEARDTKTCSLHCIVRLAKRHLTNPEYERWISSVRMDYDRLVTLLTYIGHLTLK